MLLAVAATVLLHEASGAAGAAATDQDPSTATPGRCDAFCWAVGLAAGALLLVTMAGATVQRQDVPAPWNLDAALSEAVSAAIDSRHSDAEVALERAERWNPDAWALPAVRAVAEHAAGQRSDAELAAAVTPRGDPMAEQALVSARLLDAEAPQHALEVLEGLRPVVAAREAWGVETRAAELSLLVARATVSAEGCGSAYRVWEEERRWLREVGVGPRERLALREVWEAQAEALGCWR